MLELPNSPLMRILGTTLFFLVGEEVRKLLRVIESIAIIIFQFLPMHAKFEYNVVCLVKCK